MSAPMTQDQIAAVLADHGRWLRGEGGNRANLDGANLVGVRLVGARLDGARLDGANLDRARLDGASLVGVRLVGARLDGARLDGARLVGVRLVGAKINGKIAISILRRATRKDSYEFFLWHCQEGYFIKAGCHFFTMADARQHWTATRAGTPLGDESLDILDFFDAAIKRQEAAQ